MEKFPATSKNLPVDRDSEKIIAWELGCHGKKTMAKSQPSECFEYTSDHWEAYGDFIPGDRYIRSKAEKFTAEGTNNP